MSCLAVTFMTPKINSKEIPAFLLGTAFNMAYWNRKYHSGTICKGEEIYEIDEKKKETKDMCINA